MTSGIATILNRHECDRAVLLDILWDVQRESGYISAEVAAAIADWLGLSVEDVLETATFYHFFHTTPSGRHRIYLSNNVIAKMRGYRQVHEALEIDTGTRFGGPGSADFGLFETACIGLSDHEPAMLIDDVVFTDLTPASVGEIIEGLKRGNTAAQIANPAGLPRDGVAYVDALTRTAVHTSGPVFFCGDTDYSALVPRCLAMAPEDVIATVSESGLRGLGGAGFPTGNKWKFCRAANGDEKYIICNADEGEPGTFKDRALLTYSPKQVFVGMAIAAHGVGARHGILYLRAEYVVSARLPRTAVGGTTPGWCARRRVRHPHPAGCRVPTSAATRPRFSSPARVSGERRDSSRLSRSSMVSSASRRWSNNVETFAAATRIMQEGAGWFAAMGVPGSTGTRLLSVAGDCAAPGIYEAEWGVTLRDMLEMVGADNPRAVQISGPSGEMLSVDADADRRLAYDDLSCNGSFMVFNHGRDLIDIVGDFMQFFVDESCGICVPCRAGNVMLRQKIGLVAAGRAIRSDLDDMVAWGGIVAHTSRCGLGATSPNPILSTLKKFPDIYSARLRERNGELLPSFDHKAELTGYAQAVAALAPQESL